MWFLKNYWNYQLSKKSKSFLCIFCSCPHNLIYFYVIWHTYVYIIAIAKTMAAGQCHESWPDGDDGLCAYCTGRLIAWWRDIGAHCTRTLRVRRTERNGMEQNRVEQNGMERNETKDRNAMSRVLCCIRVCRKYYTRSFN